MTGRTLTGEQRRAVETRGTPIVLTAGAGSGKTTVLTERYLSCVLNDGLPIRELAAITFTEKAATEMRRRIRNALEQRRAAEPSNARWTDLLRDLETASIGTIHSFCGQLLRRFAVAARVDPGFTVLEPAIVPSVRGESVRATLFELLLADSEAGRALADLVVCYGWDAVRTSIDDLLQYADRGRWREWISKPAEEWVGTWVENGRPAAIAAFLGHEARPGGPIDRLLRHLRSPAVRASGAAANAAIILETFPRLADAADAAELCRRMHDAAVVKGVTTAKEWANRDDYEALKDGFALLRKRLKELEPLLEIPDDAKRAAEIGRRFLIVAAACDDAYAAAKRRRNELDFDDLIEQARNLLRDHADVRAACRRTYRRVLVDELQDTDPVQMEMIEALTGTDERLFAVGDAKQSIYRFRGADVDLFNALREKVPEDGRQTLQTNFRSQPGVLNFVNALLDGALTKYEPLIPSVPQALSGPNVEFLFIETPGSTEAQRSVLASVLARRLADLIHSGSPLVTDRPRGGPPEPRAVRPGDIVLLFRSMSHVATYEQALEAEGLDYYVVGGTAFYTRQEVFDWLDLFSALENPLDDLALAGALRSPFAGLSDDALYLLSLADSGLWSGLQEEDRRRKLPPADRDAARRITERMIEWRAIKDRVPISELFRRVLNDSGYDAALQLESLGSRKLANLWKLQELARQFDAAGGFTLSAFVERLAGLIETPPREEQAATQPAEAGHVIRLMSIHQAKGLEFPLVVLPEFSAKTGGILDRVVWSPTLGCVANPPDEEPPVFPDFAYRYWRQAEAEADRAEALRILYVATTRAMDYLLLTGALPEKKNQTNPGYELLVERFDLATGELRDPGRAPEERPQVVVTDPQSVGRRPRRPVKRRHRPS